MDDNEKMVEFHKFCDSCKHADVKEWEDPCHECLSEPTNVASIKPINYEEKEKK